MEDGRVKRCEFLPDVLFDNQKYSWDTYSPALAGPTAARSAPLRSAERAFFPKKKDNPESQRAVSADATPRKGGPQYDWWGRLMTLDRRGNWSTVFSGAPSGHRDCLGARRRLQSVRGRDMTTRASREPAREQGAR